MLTVTEMSLEDIDEVLEVEAQCFKTPWSKNAFEMELKNMTARYVVAKEDGVVIGYGGIWLIIDEGHITNIAVRENHRGKNVGSRILSALIDICKSRDISSMTLEVRVSNEPAKKLYAKYGFKEAGIRPRYYTDNNEDAMIMWLTF